MPTTRTGPKVWILTGGIATGKSTAGAILRAQLPTAGWFDADCHVAELLATAEVLAAVRESFGKKVFDRVDGTLNRAALRDSIVQDRQARLELEGILHPRVRQGFAQALDASQRAGTGLFIADVPLFFEAGKTYPADRVIVVAVSAATQRSRLAARSQWPPAAIDGMLAAQWPITEKLALCDVAWWNEGPVGVLERQIQRCCAG